MSTMSTAVLLASMFALGFGVTSYKGQAQARGWAVGEWFCNDTSWINILGFISLVTAAVFIFIWLDWITAIVAILSGVFGAFFLTNVFKSMFQFLSFLLVPLYAAAWWFLGVF